MSRLRLNKIATPATPPASKGELYYSSTLSPASLAWIDENGSVSRVGGDFVNSSTANQTGFAADTYLAGSSINIGTVGAWRAQAFYRCVFDMVKTGAGTAAIVMQLRIGTAGTTADASILSFTFSAQTAVVDTGLFIVDAVFRTIGSGTSAVVAGCGIMNHQLATTGLGSLASGGGTEVKIVTSSGFNSTTSNIIGVSFNGGASFSGTNVMVAATLEG